MSKNELNDEYFEWMYQLVCNESYSKGLSYKKLLNHLHNINFEYIIGMDGNRAEDGVDLRYRFGYELGYKNPIIAQYIDHQDCSVFEMLIALAIRCEEHIMDNPEIGDRTGLWFWNMIENLGLSSMKDRQFDVDVVDDIIATFLNREYKRNGDGGLFTLKRSNVDLRTIEIWYQMCWYLNENFTN